MSMPFHNQQNPENGIPNSQHGIASGLLQAAQTLGSIASPATHSRNTSGATNNLGYLPSNNPTPATANGAPYPSQSVASPPSSHYRTPSGTASYANTPSSMNANSYFDTQAYRQPAEDPYAASAYRAPSDMSQYQVPSNYGTSETLPHHLQQSAQQQPQPPASANIPGSLQPGHMSRPQAHTMNSAPGSVPTLPHMNTQLQEPSTPSRPPPSSNHHSYSRSSPAGMDQNQKYKGYGNAPETPRIQPPTNYGGSQSASGASYSPLGLADIRGRNDFGAADGPMSPNTMTNNGENLFPSLNNHMTPWPAYAIDWCKWPIRQNGVDGGKIALGSYLEDGHNYINILDAHKAQPDAENPHAERGLEFTKTAEAAHSFPVTRILWEPPSSNKQSTDLLATSGDHLRLWSLPADGHSSHSSYITRSANKEPTTQKLAPLALLSNSKSPEHTAPITSLDWNIVSPSLIITSSIDTTCTIWDIPTLTAKTQLIAHDKEVFDVRFCAQSVDVFVSCGADGSVRMFDLRSLEHSTIIYEPSDKDRSLPSPGNVSPGTAGSSAFPPPLLRIAASPHDSHLLATFSQDSSVVRVLDVRQPGQALLELKGHNGSANCIEWSPNHRGLLASGGDDCQVMLWDLMSYAGAVTAQPAGTATERGPSATWACDYEVSNISWSPGEDGLGVVGGRGLWAVNM